MCIRDSHLAAHADLELGSPGDLDRPRDQPQDRRMQRRVAAVSYTHLRAHETVLDLVCRLLLEKKNKNT